jgi:GMP synthase PP-ATPase subunit
MEGVVDDEKLRGMVPQAFYYVFAGVEGHGKNMEFLVRGSFLEVSKGSFQRCEESVMIRRIG